MQSLPFVKLNKVLWIAVGFTNLKTLQAEAITGNIEVDSVCEKR
jgi:hypothetical protein